MYVCMYDCTVCMYACMSCCTGLLSCMYVCMYRHVAEMHFRFMQKLFMQKLAYKILSVRLVFSKYTTVESTMLFIGRNEMRGSCTKDLFIWRD